MKYLFVLFFLSSIELSAQIDTTAIKNKAILYAYLDIVESGYESVTAIDINDYLEHSKCKILKSKGFLSDMVFFSLEFRYKDIYIYDFILVSDEKGYWCYRLKGFSDNQFRLFLQHLKEKNYDNIGREQAFLKNYWVEELDLACLYKGHKRLKKEYYSRSFEMMELVAKYPCFDFFTLVRIVK